MPYAPDKPWDSGLSYTYGQSCIYNDLRYVWFNVSTASNIGVDPTVDEVLFTAYGPFGSTPESRMERGWILADNGTASGDTYGNVELIVKEVRGIPQAPSRLYYDKPQGIKWFPKTMRFEWMAEFPDGSGGFYTAPVTELVQNKSELSWAFYGQPSGYSTDYGLENVTPHGTVPADYGLTYPGLYNNFYPDNLDRISLNVVGSTEPPEPGKLKFRVAASWPFLDEPTGHGTAAVNEASIWFNRDVPYTVTFIFYVEPPWPLPPTNVITSVSGTLNTGPQTDPPYGVIGPNHEVTLPEYTVNQNQLVQYNSFNPPLDN